MGDGPSGRSASRIKNDTIDREPSKVDFTGQNHVLHEETRRTSWLNVQDLHKSFVRGHPVITGLQLEVKQGEILALAGESGCGKTTLLRLIAGFESPDSGTVILNGRLLNGTSRFVEPEDRGIGMVFQDHALFPHLTVSGNISFGLRSFVAEERKHRIDHVLGLTRLSGYENRYPRELSGGQQQRLALARALAPRPSLLLLDEPFNTLHPGIKDELLTEVRRILVESGTTSILISHDASEAYRLADRLAIVHEGRIWAVDTPQDLYRRPPDLYTAAFFGRANILRCPRRGWGVVRPEDLEPVSIVGTEDSGIDNKAVDDFLDVVCEVREIRRMGSYTEVLARARTCFCPGYPGVSIADDRPLYVHLWAGKEPVPGQELRLRAPTECLWFFSAKKMPDAVG